MKSGYILCMRPPPAIPSSLYPFASALTTLRRPERRVLAGAMSRINISRHFNGDSAQPIN
jgi:hypothetical protein